jgi:hypothetical protein
VFLNPQWLHCSEKNIKNPNYKNSLTKFLQQKIKQKYAAKLINNEKS